MTTRIYPNLGYLADEHGYLRFELLPINDAGASQTELWSAYKTYSVTNDLQAQITALGSGTSIDDLMISTSTTWSSDKIDTELSLKEDVSNKNQINGYAGLDGTGLLSISLIPNLTASKITDFDTEVSNNTNVTANTAKVSNATHTGDVTGSVALTIANDVVTFAKIQNLTANTLIGSIVGGDPQEISCTAAGFALLDDASASAQRTTLGLGTMAVQNSATVTITGGSITGITDLTIADGGTGASDISTARINLKTPGSDATGITGASEVSNIVTISQTDYNNIITPNTSTIYYIV